MSDDQQGEDQPQGGSDDGEPDQQEQDAANTSSEDDSPSSGEEVLSSSDEYKPKLSSDSPDSDLDANILENDNQLSEIGDKSQGDNKHMDQEVDSSQKQEQEDVEMSESIDEIPDSQPPYQKLCLSPFHQCRLTWKTKRPMPRRQKCQTKKLRLRPKKIQQKTVRGRQ